MLVSQTNPVSIARAIVYFCVPEDVLMAEIYVACFGFKDED